MAGILRWVSLFHFEIMASIWLKSVVRLSVRLSLIWLDLGSNPRFQHLFIRYDCKWMRVFCVCHCDMKNLITAGNCINWFNYHSLHVNFHAYKNKIKKCIRWDMVKRFPLGVITQNTLKRERKLMFVGKEPAKRTCNIVLRIKITVILTKILQ